MKSIEETIRIPIVTLYSDKLGNRINIWRDDLLPYSFGGNKVRIAYEFILDMYNQRKNCMIGYGSAYSNMSRALASFCKAYQIPCYIVSPSDIDGERQQTYNSYLVDLCGATVVHCTKNNVAEIVENTIEKCRNNGLRPYYIYGDKFGIGNESVAVRAYKKVYDEIICRYNEGIKQFDYIFLPTGTGMTQAGLLVGALSNDGGEKIVGISVARERKKEEQIILRYVQSMFPSIKGHLNADKLIVSDDYLCGGYGQYTQGVEQVIYDIYCKYGVPLDPTYTGKAFYGMLKYLENNNICNNNILFLHTGGTPLFFDYLAHRNPSPKIIKSKDKVKLMSFLLGIDKSLPVALSKRVSFDSYIDKLIEMGEILSIEKDSKIVAAVLFYCNDYRSRNAYISLLGTLPGFEGQGYGTCLIKAAENTSKENGMTSILLDTDKCNLKAIAFYSKCGYQVESAEDKLHLKKDL